MSDPFASIAKPLQKGGQDDPFASIARDTTAPTDTRNSIQKSFDTETQTNPNDPLLQHGLKSVVGTIGAPFVHPLQTAKSLLNSDYATQYKQAQQQPKQDLAHGVVEGLGQAFGGAALGAAGGEALSNLKAGGSALRSAAAGNPDAAALRGLQIGPKSDAQLSTLKSVGQARPYLKGATSQADMQARLSPAMNEVWDPYKSAVDVIGDRPVKGPDGMTTVRELEAERMRLSALNRGVKSGNPSDIQQAMQEGRTPAQLIQRESDVQNALDPHLSSTGIKPQAVRGTYGALADVRSGVEGKTTLNENPKPSGFGRMLNIKATEPRTYIGEPMRGARDIVAGRPWWSAKPTDLGIKEGFATGGPKPDLGRLTAPNLMAARPAGLPAQAPPGSSPCRQNLVERQKDTDRRLSMPTPRPCALEDY